MVKKIVLSFSLVLFSLICFSLMGTKVYANSYQTLPSEFDESLELYSVNNLRSVSLVSDDTYQDERVIYNYGVSHSYNEFVQKNNNVIINGVYADDNGIAIESGENYLIFDIDENNRYNELILDVGFVPMSSFRGVDLTNYNLSVRVYNSDNSNLVFNDAKLYRATIYYRILEGNSFGPIQKYDYNYVTSDYELSSYLNDVSIPINNALFDLFVDMLSLELINGNAFPVAMTDVVIGFVNTDYSTQYLIEDLSFLGYNAQESYFPIISSSGTFNIWTSFLYPSLNSFINTDLFLGLSISSIIGIVVAIPITIYILKVFFGG